MKQISRRFAYVNLEKFFVGIAMTWENKIQKCMKPVAFRRQILHSLLDLNNRFSLALNKGLDLGSVDSVW